jgi:hypothetical protein
MLCGEAKHRVQGGVDACSAACCGPTRQAWSFMQALQSILTPAWSLDGMQRRTWTHESQPGHWCRTQITRSNQAQSGGPWVILHCISTLISCCGLYTSRSLPRSPSVSGPHVLRCSLAAAGPWQLHHNVAYAIVAVAQTPPGPEWRLACSRLPPSQTSGNRPARPLQATGRCQINTTPPCMQGLTPHQHRASSMSASSSSEAGAAIAAKQAELFSNPDTIQEFLVPLPEDINQVGARQLLCLLLRHCIAYGWPRVVVYPGPCPPAMSGVLFAC